MECKGVVWSSPATLFWGESVGGSCNSNQRASSELPTLQGDLRRDLVVLVSLANRIVSFKSPKSIGVLSPSMVIMVAIPTASQAARKTSGLSENTEIFVVCVDICPSGVVVTRSRPSLDISINTSSGRVWDTHNPGVVSAWICHPFSDPLSAGTATVRAKLVVLHSWLTSPGVCGLTPTERGDDEAK